jgi:hypothetical protein
MSAFQLFSFSKESRILAATAITAVLLSTLLLSLQYSYGIGTTTYSLAQYIWRTWNESEDMGHGFLVLPFACFPRHGCNNPPSKPRHESHG